MGTVCCRQSIYLRHRHLAPWKHQFEALRFTEREIERLYQLFRRVWTIRFLSIELNCSYGYQLCLRLTTLGGCWWQRLYWACRITGTHRFGEDEVHRKNFFNIWRRWVRTNRFPRICIISLELLHFEQCNSRYIHIHMYTYVTDQDF